MTEGSGSVLGANTMRGHDVFFDIPETSRIGFAPSDCDYYNLIEETNDDVNEDIESNRKENLADDYYEEDEKALYGDQENDEKSNDENLDFDDDNILHPATSKVVFGHEIESNLFMAIASIFITSLVGFMVVAVVKQCRRGDIVDRRYDISDENLDDLHLDEERLPAIA